MPCYHSITQNQIFTETISIWGKPINIYNSMRLQNGVSSIFRMIHKIDIQSSKCFFFFQNIKVQKNGTGRSSLKGVLVYSKIDFFHWLSLVES